MKAFLGILIGLTVSAWGAPVGKSEFVPLQHRAQGRSLTGSNTLNDSLYTNPAGSAFTRVYSVDATFMAPRAFAVSVLDTQASNMAGALGYFRMPRGGFDQVTQGAKLALAGRVTPYLAFGAAGKAIWGPDLAGTSATYKDMDLGTLLSVESFQLGITARNLFGGNPAMGAFREYGLGGRIEYEKILFLSVAAESDVGEDLTPDQYGIGAEFVSPYYFAIKGGWRIRPEQSATYWSVGASIVSQRASLHYAMEIPQQNDEEVAHVVGATVLF